MYFSWLIGLSLVIVMLPAPQAGVGEIVNGTVKGPVYARRMLELQPKARIEGDVYYTSLEMHQGAIIAGLLRPTPSMMEDKPTLKLAANN